MFKRILIVGCIFLSGLGGIALSESAAQGLLEGHLRITSLKAVELAEGNAPAVTAEMFGQYPLIILSRDGQKEIARVTADASGNYRIPLPAADYVLDVQGRALKHVRAKPQEFTVVSNQTTQVDLEIDWHSVGH